MVINYKFSRRKSMQRMGWYKTWTLDSGLDYELDYGLDYELEYGLGYGLDFGLDSKLTLRFQAFTTSST